MQPSSIPIPSMTSRATSMRSTPSCVCEVNADIQKPREDSEATGHASNSYRQSQAGFTLIEIMAVVVIMGMLMATLAVGIAGQLDNAQRKNAKAQIIRIEQALEFYKLDNRRFPTTDQGLDALINEPSAPPAPRDYNPAGYIKKDAIEDPWGAAFEYRIPGEQNLYTFDIWSLGPDGVEGGDDIQNWDSGE